MQAIFIYFITLCNACYIYYIYYIYIHICSTVCAACVVIKKKRSPANSSPVVENQWSRPKTCDQRLTKWPTSSPTQARGRGRGNRARLRLCKGISLPGSVGPLRPPFLWPIRRRQAAFPKVSHGKRCAAPADCRARFSMTPTLFLQSRTFGWPSSCECGSRGYPDASPRECIYGCIGRRSSKRAYG